MSRNVDTVISRVLSHEGGIVNLHDGRGVTRYGQTPGWLEDWGFVPPNNQADAAVNYEKWMKLTRLSEVCDIDLNVGYVTTDYAVHAGDGIAVKAMQKALGEVMDGLIGPKTLQALQACDSKRVSRSVYADRLRHMGKLLGSEHTDRRNFAAGWLNRMALIAERLP